jgi:hypothetical protein
MSVAESAAPVPGRVSITSRAYEHLVRAIAADALGVGRRTGSVRVSDDRGRLAIEVTGAVRGEGAPVLQQIGRARDTVAARTAALTGAEVSRVRFHITSVTTSGRRTR